MKNCIYVVLLLFFFSSCDSFLEEYSQDLTYAKTASDLDELLIGDGYMKITENSVIGLGSTDGYYFPWIHVMDDDITQVETGWNADGSAFTALANFYLWAEYPYMQEGEEVSDGDWKRLYKHISSLNVILSKTETINDQPQEIERIKGECYFLRGVYYFYLANIYAKPYSKSTASTDLGVPLKTTEYIEDVYFQRNTLEETYDRIVDDLTTAARLLKRKEHKTVYRAGFHAAHAFLSRVYLYMEEYEKVLLSVDTVLQGGYALLDYNERLALVNPGQGGTISKEVSVTYKDSPETIFSQGGNCFASSTGGMMSMYNFSVSEDLLEMFNREPGNDLRFGSWLGVYKDPNNPSYWVEKLADEREDGVVSSECLVRLPEILLNKAEALAMLSREDEVMNVIEELRSKRMKQDTYVALDRRTGEKLIELIRDERRRELCFEGHRWFDLRRYAVNTKYPYTKKIIHDQYFYSSTTWTREYLGSYELKEYNSEPAYVIPIPRSVIEFNKGNMVDNATRPQREMFKRF